jgi:Spy/CpxP family protein refolding chaperone
MGPRALIALLCVVNLLVGAAAGVAIDRSTRSGGRGHRRGPPTADRMVQRLTDELELTPEQAAQIKAIFEGQQAAFKEAMAQVQAAAEEVRPRMDALRARTDEEITALLTPPQRLRFAELQAEDSKRFSGRGGPGWGDRRSEPAATDSESRSRGPRSAGGR